MTFYPLEVEYEGSENEDEEIKVDVVVSVFKYFSTFIPLYIYSKEKVCKN